MRSCARVHVCVHSFGGVWGGHHIANRDGSVRAANPVPDREHFAEGLIARAPANAPFLVVDIVPLGRHDEDGAQDRLEFADGVAAVEVMIEEPVELHTIEPTAYGLQRILSGGNGEHCNPWNCHRRTINARASRGRAHAQKIRRPSLKPTACFGIV